MPDDARDTVSDDALDVLIQCHGEHRQVVLKIIPEGWLTGHILSLGRGVVKIETDKGALTVPVSDVQDVAPAEDSAQDGLLDTDELLNTGRRSAIDISPIERCAWNGRPRSANRSHGGPRFW